MRKKVFPAVLHEPTTGSALFGQASGDRPLFLARELFAGCSYCVTFRATEIGHESAKPESLSTGTSNRVEDGAVVAPPYGDVARQFLCGG